MKSAGAFTALILLRAAMAWAATNATPLVAVDTADSGDTNFLMRIEEIERHANTSKLRLTYNKMGSSVGSSMFIMRGFYEVARSRGTEYFINLKEWDDSDGSRLYIGGFTDTKNADLHAEFGNEYALTNAYGQARGYMSVSEMRRLFERPARLSDAERAAKEHLGKIYAGDVAAATNDTERFQALCAAIDQAKNAGDLHLAREQAEKLERMAPDFKGKPGYGNAVQDFNQVLGRIALAEGNIDEAKRRLIASADSEGSPTLNSFGPNMTLAKELLRKGETEVVLQYFDLCRKFWKRHADTLDRWTEDVKHGRLPDFGANLVY